jgi:SAM-dependent methyltransferase
MKTVACPLCDAPVIKFDFSALLHSNRAWDVFHCRVCDSSFYWPVPPPAEIARCYPHSYFNDFFKQYWKDYYKGRFLAAGIGRWRAKGHFLDVGCALGTVLAGFRDASGWEVSGLEYMPYASKAGQELNNVTIHTGGILNAPWAPETFDYIHANNVLEHEADPVGAITKAAQLLKPGGRLHLVLPNGKMDALPNQLLYRKTQKPMVTRHSGHLFFYSRTALKGMLERAGFRITALRNFHFKTALKAHGWTPGAWKKFYETASTIYAENTTAPGSVEAYKQLIPRRPSWLLYQLKMQWRRLWRLPGLESGYDFEIIAEKNRRS